MPVDILSPHTPPLDARHVRVIRLQVRDRHQNPRRPVERSAELHPLPSRVNAELYMPQVVERPKLTRPVERESPIGELGAVAPGVLRAEPKAATRQHAHE